MEEKDKPTIFNSAKSNPERELSHLGSLDVHRESGTVLNKRGSMKFKR